MEMLAGSYSHSFPGIMNVDKGNLSDPAHPEVLLTIWVFLLLLLFVSVILLPSAEAFYITTMNSTGPNEKETRLPWVTAKRYFGRPLMSLPGSIRTLQSVCQRHYVLVESWKI